MLNVLSEVYVRQDAVGTDRAGTCDRLQAAQLQMGCIHFGYFLRTLGQTPNAQKTQTFSSHAAMRTEVAAFTG